MNKENKIEIYLSGVGINRPRIGGWSYTIYENDLERKDNSYEPRATQPRMILVAAIKAIQSIPEESNATIFTTSDYLINGATIWRYRSKRNKKKPIKHAKLWKQLRSLNKTDALTWVKVNEDDNNVRHKMTHEQAQKALKEACFKF